MRNIETEADRFTCYGTVTVGGSEIRPEVFVADDLMDPCSNNGEGKRLHGVTCIGGHVVSLSFVGPTSGKISAFPPSISSLAHLRHIYIEFWCGAPFKLVISCEFGQLANLKALVITQSHGSLEFPENDACMNGLVSMEEVMLGAHKMNRFPPSFLQLPQMQTVSLTKAPVASLPATMSSRMRVLKLSGVGASGPLPSFRGSALLEQVYLNNNNLQLGEANAFDNCPNLRTLDVSHNNLSASVFSFDGSTNVESIELSHNAIHGGIPSQWAQLKSCEVVKASHNFIVAPTNNILPMSKLEVLNLNHNQIDFGLNDLDEGTITYLGSDLDQWGFINWFFKIAPANMASFDLSFNLLKEQEGHIYQDVLLQGNSIRYPQLQRLDVSHNYLWGWLTLNSLFFNADVSYNNITMVSAESATSCCTATAYRRQMYSVDWTHQISDVSLGRDELGIGWTIDQALNTTVDFKQVEFMPRHDSFKQIELPAGSGRFPFACPAWLVIETNSFARLL
jgi:Leucine-rich repeat (LRR) protein